MLVGPGKQRFDIHKGLLCKSSGRFQASLLGPSKEASGKIELPEHAPSTFAFFQHWLYREKFRGFHDVEFNKPTITHPRSVAQEVAISGKPRKSKKKSLHYLGLEHQDLQAYSLANYKDVPFTAFIDLYVLADFLQATQLKDSIISMLVEVYDHYIPSTYEDKDDNATLLFQTHNAAIRPADLEGPATGMNRAWEATASEIPYKKATGSAFLKWYR